MRQMPGGQKAHIREWNYQDQFYEPLELKGWWESDEMIILGGNKKNFLSTQDR